MQAHVGGASAEASAKIGARAYAVGNSVAFAGQPDLHTAAHEAAHVVQQRSGAQLKGGVDGGAGDPYEQHADAVADAVVAGRSAEALLAQPASAGRSTSTEVQRAPAEHQQAPGAMVTVSLFDKNRSFITSRSEPLYSEASQGVYLAQVHGDTLNWTSDPIEVQLGDKVGPDGKLLGGISIAAWAKQAGKGRAVYIFVEVDPAELRTQEANPAAKPWFDDDSTKSAPGSRSSSAADGTDPKAVGSGGTMKGKDTQGAAGDDETTHDGNVDAAGHDGKSKNADGEEGGTREKGGRGKTGGADGSRFGKHGATKRDIGHFWDPNRQHDGSQDVAPDNADKDGMVGGTGKSGDHGIPDVGAWKARIPIPRLIAAAVAVGAALYQANIQKIAQDAIKLAEKATASELQAFAMKEIESLTEREVAALVQKDAQFAAMTDAELVEAKNAVRAQVVDKLVAELDAQAAGAEKAAAIDRAQSAGENARYAADDLKEEQERLTATKRARDAVSSSPKPESAAASPPSEPVTDRGPGKVAKPSGAVAEPETPAREAASRSQFEQYKAELRRDMEKPAVKDPQLKSLVDRLYRPGAKVGSGSTAAAIREERATGATVGGRLHTQKGYDSIAALKNWLQTHPNADPGDVAAARDLILDLEDALR